MTFHLHIDADSLVYAAAVAAQQTTYALIDTSTNEELKSFRRHKEYIDFIALVEAGFEQLQVPLDQTRIEKTVKALSFNKATKALSKLLKQWLKIGAGDKEDVSYTCYIADPYNSSNFRNDIATLLPYKGNRNHRDKPIYLQQLREYAVNLPHFRVVTGIEADDASLAAAVAAGKNGCLMAVDKDARQVTGTYFCNPDTMKAPVYSPRNTVGYIELKSNNKLTGLGHLHLLAQLLTGDVTDNILGLPKYGAIRAAAMLTKYNNTAWADRGNAVREVMQAYKEHYGDAHTYKHAYTGEEVTKSWKELIDENFLLLWMQRFDGDTGSVIADFWRKEY